MNFNLPDQLMKKNYARCEYARKAFCFHYKFFANDFARSDQVLKFEILVMEITLTFFLHTFLLSFAYCATCYSINVDFYDAINENISFVR